jgi:hypothetical protein
MQAVGLVMKSIETNTKCCTIGFKVKEQPVYRAPMAAAPVSCKWSVWKCNRGRIQYKEKQDSTATRIKKKISLIVMWIDKDFR